MKNRWCQPGNSILSEINSNKVQDYNSIIVTQRYITTFWWSLWDLFTINIKINILLRNIMYRIHNKYSSQIQLKHYFMKFHFHISGYWFISFLQTKCDVTLEQLYSWAGRAALQKCKKRAERKPSLTCFLARCWIYTNIRK